MLNCCFMYVELCGDVLRVRNFRRSPRVINVRDIAGIDPGYAGLEIRLMNSRLYNAWAVQQPNWRVAVNRPGRSAAVVLQILEKRDRLKSER